MDIGNLQQCKIRDIFTTDQLQERYIVPSYQRRYEWKKKQWDDLITDIMNIKSDDKHYFGTIMVSTSTHRIGGDINILKIIDGQQRIVTISIVLLSIKNVLEERDSKSEIIKEIEHRLTMNNNYNRIELNNIDKENYKNLLNNNLNRIKNKKLKGAFEYFKKFFTNKNSEELKNIYNKIMNQIIYIQIPIKTAKDQYFLFESMNFRGLNLSPVDLMKNHTFFKASELNNNNEKKIEKLWSQIIRYSDEIKINKPAITFFRQFFMSSKEYGVNEKVSKTTSILYGKIYKDKINNCKNYNEFDNFIRSIKYDAEIYNKLLKNDINKFKAHENYEINNLLKDARIVSITLFTLFLRMIKEIDKTDLIKKIIRVSTNYIFRRQISGRSTAPHDSLFNHLAQKAFNRDNPLDYIKNYLQQDDVNDKDFKNNFAENTYRTNDRTKYILDKLEEDQHGHGGKKIVEDRFNVHIEHIMPQSYCKSLEKNWLKPLDISKEKHKIYKNKIGNLLLLEKKPNLRASNKTFKRKKEFYKNTMTDFGMAHLIAEQDSWDIPKIENRSKDLAEIASNIWKI